MFNQHWGSDSAMAPRWNVRLHTGHGAAEAKLNFGLTQVLVGCLETLLKLKEKSHPTRNTLRTFLNRPPTWGRLPRGLLSSPPHFSLSTAPSTSVPWKIELPVIKLLSFRIVSSVAEPNAQDTYSLVPLILSHPVGLRTWGDWSNAGLGSDNKQSASISVALLSPYQLTLKVCQATLSYSSDPCGCFVTVLLLVECLATWCNLFSAAQYGWADSALHDSREYHLIKDFNIYYKNFCRWW